MIHPSEFYNILIENEIDFFTGVPDSLLKDFCGYLTDNVDSKNHVIAANEGNAVALAAGYHLATNKVGLVYMQNSGQGNAVNPLTSLVDPEVYSIPMLLLIGWRGEPGKQDEPQHVKQGKITIDLLNSLRIPHEILPDSLEETEKILEKAVKYTKEKNAPFALVAKKGVFEKYELKNETSGEYELAREEAIQLVVDSLSDKDLIVSTTGKTSRELFEYREKLKQKHNKDFLTVGSMGHASQIALGISLQKPDKNIYCFDGDGSIIMHMGSLAIIGQLSPKNFRHIVFNNGAHDSVGGQLTAGFTINIQKIAEACGYKTVLGAKTKKEVLERLELLKSSEGPALLEIKVSKGSRKDLGRPTINPIKNKKDFMDFLSEK